LVFGSAKDLLERIETMSKQRRKHSGAFKARVALEALKGIKTVSQLAADYEIHPVQVSKWKKELQERLPEVFEKPKKADLAQEKREEARLERKVGQLTMELDWLKKKCDELQIPIGER
jgi:transposase